MKYLFMSIIASTFSVDALADADDAAPTKDDFAGRIKIEVPQSSGFTLLGVTPENIIEPNSGQELGVSLLQGLDTNGNLQTGYALETRPFLWNQDEYIFERTKINRILSGFKVSFATTSGASDDDQATRYGIGTNWSYQFNDPMFNKKYKNCVKIAGDAAPPIPDSEDTLENLNKTLRKAILSCQKEHISWTTTSVSAGVAAQWGSEDEENIDTSGYGVWLTGSKALSNSAEITGHARYIENQLSVVDDALTESDSSILALRFRFGSFKTKAIFETSYTEEEANSATDKYSLAVVGTELKLSENMWFRIVYGDTFGSDSEKKEFFTGQVRFGLGEKSVAGF